MELSVRRPLLVFSCLIVALLLVFYWPFLRSERAFYWGDHGIYFEPLCRYIGQAMALGRLPLWNPLIGCGQSQLAIASPGLFYPTTVLFALMDYSRAVALQMVLHQLLVAVGFYVLIRKLGWGESAAAFGGLIAALNGYMFGLTPNFTLVFTASWLPLALASVLFATSRESRSKLWGTACGALSVAFMLIAGRPEVWLPGMVALAVLALYPALRHRSRSGLLASAWGLAVIACGILIAMISLLPAFEWSRLSPRTISSITKPWEWSASWYDFISLVFGLPYGDPSVHFLKLQSELYPHVPLLPTAFFGSVACTLALLGMWDRAFRWRWHILGVFAFTSCLAAGNNLPVFPLMLKLFPFLSLLRYPSKFEIFLDFIVALLAARGMFYLVQPNQSRKTAIFAVAALWLCCAVVGALLWLIPSYSWFGFHGFAESYAPGYGSDALAKLGLSVLLWSLVGIITALICYLAEKTQAHMRSQAICVCVLFLGVAGSLFFISYRYCRTSAGPDFYRRPSLAADLIHRLDKAIVPPRMVPILPLGLTALPSSYHPEGEEIGFDSVALFKRQILEENVPLDYGLGLLYGYEGSLTRPIRVLELATIVLSSQVNPKMSDLLNGRVCQMTSTGYVTGLYRGSDSKILPLLDKRYFQLLNEVPALNMRLYKTVDVLPFSYFISKWKFEETDREALGCVLNVERNRFDPHYAVMLTPAAAGKLDLRPSDPAAPTIIVPITPTSYSPEQIVLRVHAPVDGVVVVNDNIYPGWQVTVDKAPADLVRANTTFKAVAVKAGWHDIVFEFKPLVLPISAALSLLGLIMTGLLCWVAKRVIADKQ